MQQKPFLLLKALIAFGGRDVKEEQLCDALWPDAEGDLAHRSFETTLYRLRQLIGKDKAIQLKEGRLTLDRQSCWVDAFALEQVLNEAEGLWETRSRCQADPQRLRDTTARAIQLTQRAIDLVPGAFSRSRAGTDLVALSSGAASSQIHLAALKPWPVTGKRPESWRWP